MSKFPSVSLFEGKMEKTKMTGYSMKVIQLQTSD